jgi:hypothetical protein
MAKPDYPDILSTPIQNLDEEFPDKLKALAKYFGGFEYAEEGKTDWQIVAMNMALEYVPGFQVGPAPKKRGGQVKPRTAARDFYLANFMQHELSKHPNEQAAANAVWNKYPILGNTEETVLRRWKVLKRCEKEFERMKEYATRVHNWPE